tara:strand:- start:233 stop:424 length:192 start_codon:yes stop_codon:yes gene_type:complete
MITEIVNGGGRCNGKSVVRLQLFIANVNAALGHEILVPKYMSKELKALGITEGYVTYGEIPVR